MSDVKVLRDSLDAISNLVMEGTFKITESGISMLSLDPAGVALVNYNLLSPCFDEFSCSKPQEMTISITNLVSILKRAKGNENVILKLEDDSNILHISIKGLSKRNFTLPLIDMQGNEQKDAGFDYPNCFEIETQVLEDGIKDASMNSDSVLFHVSEDTLTLSASRNNSSSELILENKKSPGLKSFKASGEEKAKYAIEYLEKMLKVGKLTPSVTCEFKTEFPLRLTFQEKDKLNIKFILAPRSDND